MVLALFMCVTRNAVLKTTRKIFISFKKKFILYFVSPFKMSPQGRS